MVKGRGKESQKTCLWHRWHTEILAAGFKCFWKIMGMITGDEFFTLIVGKHLKLKKIYFVL